MSTHWLIDGKADVAVSPDSRGLAYGDGVFRTLLASGGEILRVDAHLERLRDDAARLALDLPDAEHWLDDSARLLASMAMPRAVLKWMLVRKTLGRGYAPQTRACERLVGIFAAPRDDAANRQAGIAADVASIRLAIQPALAGIKHLNRLEQVLASADWPAQIGERLLLDADGCLVGGTRSNLFWVRGAVLYTPAVTHCGVAGSTRACLIRHAVDLALEAREVRAPFADLLQADEAFICNAVFGIWPLREVRGADALRRWSPGPVTQRLQAWLAHPQLT